MKHGNYQHGWLHHYCQDVGFTFDRGDFTGICG